MHILLVTHYFEPEIGAPQRRWSALIERFVANGHQVSVVTPAPHYPSGRVAAEHRHRLRRGTVHTSGTGATVYRVAHVPHRGDILTRTLDHVVAATASVAKASAIARESKPSVVVATAPAIESLIAGQVIARRLGIPFVAEMRDAWPDLVAYTGGIGSRWSPLGFFRRLVHRLVTKLQAAAAMVVTTTQSFAEVLRARGIANAVVLRNGTTHSALPAIATPEHVPPAPLRVLYMGTVGRSQGLDVLIEATRILARQGVDVDLRIVGHGADLARLQRINRAVGAPADIREGVAPADVRSHYEWAHTTVVSLRDWEPFSWTVPSKLYELLATGKHITALVAGESADIMRATGAGVVVRPGDAANLAETWRNLWSEPASLRVGNSGRAWAQQFADYDALAAKYLALLSRITSAVEDRA